MSDLIKIAVDAMGGDGSPKKVIDGIILNHQSNKNNFFKIFGNSEKISNLINGKLSEYFYEIINTDNIVKSTDSPLEGAKRGKDTSMWLAIQSVKDKETDIVISAGNTGALLIVSRLILNCIDGINKPALAGLWPNKKNMSIVLDLGANIEYDEKTLVNFSIIGSALFKSLFEKKIPKVALLNIGLEEHKGNDILKRTSTILKNKDLKNFEFCGYVEGNQITRGEIDVIVTDGFTGNIALKTAEGTANFITENFKNSLNLFSKLISFYSLKKFKEKLDPRKYNGAILLGLQGPVVKSHGSTDAKGFPHSIELCHKIVRSNLIQKIKTHLISIDP